MVEFIEVECKYCGSLMELNKAVRLNLKTGEYEYVCVNCAIKWEKDHPKLESLTPEDRQKLEHARSG